MNARDALSTFAERRVDVVSTIDHPFPSPPVFLIDGHRRLFAKHPVNCLILNWDVSNPDDRRYRYDLVTDTGLVAKVRELYHYTPKTPYAIQSLSSTPWRLLLRAFDAASVELIKTGRLRRDCAGELRIRAEELIALLQTKQVAVPWIHTRHVLTTIYSILQRNELVSFIENNYQGYWNSWITKDWIPWCIENPPTGMSLRELCASGTFQRRVFRSVDGSECVEAGADSAPKELAAALRQGALIPSLELFYWSLAIGGVKHYGSDRDFFHRLSVQTGDESIKLLQLTEQGRDCERFLEFDSDVAVPLTVSGESFSAAQGEHTSSKLTRVTSMPAALILLGEKLRTLVDNLFAGHNSAQAVPPI